MRCRRHRRNLLLSGQVASGRRRGSIIAGSPDTMCGHPIPAHIGLVRITSMALVDGTIGKAPGAGKIMITVMGMVMPMGMTKIGTKAITIMVITTMISQCAWI